MTRRTATVTPAWLGLVLGLALAPIPYAARAERVVAAAAEAAPGREDALAPWPTLAERLAEIQRRVQASVVYPELARDRGLEGVARIRFAIGDDGRAQEVETVESSGHAVLDRAAEQGAREAGSLPAIYGLVEVPVRFVLRGP